MKSLIDACLALSPTIPLYPLASFAVIIFFSKILKDRLSAFIACAAAGVSLALSIPICAGVFLDRSLAGEHAFAWQVLLISMGDFHINVGVLVDNLTAIMLVVVSLVSFLVHVYSTSYMHGDPRYPRYFAFLGIFTAAMLGLVMADNFLLLYISWELVGLASYLLIGFWFEKPEAAKAGVKAFLTTRVGDAGMFLGIATIFGVVLSARGMSGATLNFREIFAFLKDNQAVYYGAPIITVASVLLFMGAVGKSAQFPLHIWLPDAMEGPTPVSALIHAATMVAAGVYLVARLFPLFDFSPNALAVVALLGGFTALFAATMGLVMYDIKKVLAYSTVSQLGYMMLGLGVGGYTAGVFHLTTHAFFKALLFLGSGSVIHSCHDQDMRNMGGLGKKMPITCITFWIGTLALAGIPPFAGFWSKDEILAKAMKWYTGHGDFLHLLPYLFGAMAALMTAFYMTRLMVLTFSGEYRGHGHPHESPAAITVPLIVLATLAATAGLIGTPWANKFHEAINFTPAVVAEAPGHASESSRTAELTAAPAHEAAAAESGESEGEGAAETEKPNWLIMGVSTCIALLGMFLAGLIYKWKVISRDKIRSGLKPIHTLLSNKYYMDDFVQVVIMNGGLLFIGMLRWFDMNIVDGLVNLAGWIGVMWSKIEGWTDNRIVDGLVNLVGITIRAIGKVARLAQTGFVQNYLFIVLLGVLLMLLLR
jgi:NADH-quinone oxidoreductase subunit L